MKNSFINMLESIKTQTYKNYKDYLNDEDLNVIVKWFEEYSTLSGTNTETIIGLLYYLYMHENIDFYDVEHYQNSLNYLEKTYGIDKKRFIELLQNFRNIVFN